MFAPSYSIGMCSDGSLEHVAARLDPAEMAERDSDADRAMAAHAQVADVVEENHARRTQAGSDGWQRTAPTSTSEPRGSQITARRNESWCVRNRSRCSVTDPPPKSGPPATITRVGSPPVCESMTGIRCIVRSPARRDGFAMQNG